MPTHFRWHVENDGLLWESASLGAWKLGAALQGLAWWCAVARAGPWTSRLTAADRKDNRGRGLFEMPRERLQSVRDAGRLDGTVVRTAQGKSRNATHHGMLERAVA